MQLVSYFQAIADSSLSQAISTSTWAFAVIESIHLLALSVIGGSILIVDLRLLGFGLTRQTVGEVAREAQPWLMASLAVMLVTGVLLFVSEPIKCFYSTPFRIKMLCLLLGSVWAFTVRRKVAVAGEGHVRPIWLKLVALVSLVLWFGVGAGGRWIGFSG
jgi:hypothetical protein